VRAGTFPLARCAQRRTLPLTLSRCLCACLQAIGGTAVGTGIGMHPEFAVRIVEELRKLTARARAACQPSSCAARSRGAACRLRAQGLPLVETSNHFQAQATIDAVVQASRQLRAAAGRAGGA
jgi:fumarate hydratase class II